MTGYFHRSGLVAREEIEGRVRQLLASAETDPRPAILDEIDVLLHAAHVDPAVETRTGAMPLSRAYRTFQGSSATVFKDVFAIPSYTRCRDDAEALVRDIAGPGTAAGIASDARAEGCDDLLALRIVQRFMDPGRRNVRIARRLAA
ncbi:hypothetical protein BHAOGJBA_2918 [Methylobacterium hispanicum]|uniref:Uncharacterized protein n=1 Tax=Methylobacterium hispanicum TaxID=270350 RepID=A0AAV4ZLJ3_9HYPH|nr:hypothetical protein [Methylobacterium hispanicum]GJD89391.1 hypothetical protein BHAOGJBA_2918 [Methylobacterium hispanicum]